MEETRVRRNPRGSYKPAHRRRTVKIEVLLTPPEAAALEVARGELRRSEWIRQVLRGALAGRVD